MAQHEITFPAGEADVRRLRAGDTVTIQGHVTGIRDATQIRIFDQGQEPPFPLAGAALLHTAPNARKLADGGWEPISIGTTTSARMNRFTEPLLRDHGVRAIIGKGGLPADALAHWRSTAASTWRSWAAQQRSRRSRSTQSSGWNGKI